MGTTPILGIPWPELAAQADGPAAFAATASRTEQMMSNYVSGSSYFGDLTTTVPAGNQVLIVNQDIAAVAIGWAWFDVNISIAVGGPQGGSFPGPVIANAAGQIIILAQNGAQELRRLRWHSRNRAEMFSVSGGCGLSLPLATTTINLGIVMSNDAASGVNSGYAYEYNIGISQFGAPRGV